MIDVRGIPPELLLKHLYNKTHPQGMGFLHYDPTPMTTEVAKRILDEAKALPSVQDCGGKVYFDYFKGRVMKVAIGGRNIDPSMYDRDNFPGACQEAVNDAMDEATLP